MSSLLEKELDKLNVFDQEVVFSVLSKALGEFIGIKIPLWTVEAEFSETSSRSGARNESKSKTPRHCSHIKYISHIKNTKDLHWGVK